MKPYITSIRSMQNILKISVISLSAFIGLSANASVQADSSHNISNQVAMLTDISSRDEMNRELKALEEEYINAVINALNAEHSGPDYSRDEVYVDHLVQVVEGKTQLDQPNFADDAVYVDHLVRVLKM